MKTGWSEARRAKQAAQIQKWKPWRSSTGPRTQAGKEIVRKNAFKGAGTSKDMLELKALIRTFLKESKDFLDTLNNEA